MKNKWSILLSSFITMIFVFTVGCTNKEYTADELYEDFKDQISKVSSYTCIAKVEAIGNKENTTYIFKHTYKKPDYYKLEVKSPKNLKGKTIEYKNNKIIINMEVGIWIKRMNILISRNGGSITVDYLGTLE